MKKTKLAAKLIVGALAVTGVLGIIGALSSLRNNDDLKNTLRFVKDAATPI